MSFAGSPLELSCAFCPDDPQPPEPFVPPRSRSFLPSQEGAACRSSPDQRREAPEGLTGSLRSCAVVPQGSPRLTQPPERAAGLPPTAVKRTGP